MNQPKLCKLLAALSVTMTLLNAGTEACQEKVTNQLKADAYWRCHLSSRYVLPILQASERGL